MPRYERVKSTNVKLDRNLWLPSNEDGHQFTKKNSDAFPPITEHIFLFCEIVLKSTDNVGNKIESCFFFVFCFFFSDEHVCHSFLAIRFS